MATVESEPTAGRGDEACGDAWLTVTLALYKEASDRRRTYDTLFWAVPGLAVGAWVILMRESVRDAPRMGVLEASLAIALSLFALQLSAKLWHLQRFDSEIAGRLEHQLRARAGQELLVHGSRTERIDQRSRFEKDGAKLGHGEAARLNSHDLWRAALYLMVAASTGTYYRALLQWSAIPRASEAALVFAAVGLPCAVVFLWAVLSLIAIGADPPPARDP